MSYTKVEYPEPHFQRTRDILKAHPEIKSLFGFRRSTFFFIAAIVSTQVALSVLVKDWAVWQIALLGFFFGAFLNHSLFVLIHECAHNLVFRKTWSNQLAGMVANLPFLFPASAGFRHYHLIHHRHQGELDYDADLAGPKEADWVGSSFWRKALWFLFFPLVEGVIRPARLKKVKLWNRWVALNALVEVSFVLALAFFFGWQSLIYLAFSSLFCIGLHPVGGRWIQEHYLMKEGQETYSYYGPLNYTCFFVGYHNEHHDFMAVPWSQLPKVKAMAPEFYDSLYSHRSWSALLWRFLTDPKLTLHSRVIRDKNVRFPSKASATPSTALAKEAHSEKAKPPSSDQPKAPSFGASPSVS